MAATRPFSAADILVLKPANPIVLASPPQYGNNLQAENWNILQTGMLGCSPQRFEQNRNILIYDLMLHTIRTSWTGLKFSLVQDNLLHRTGFEHLSRIHCQAKLCNCSLFLYFTAQDMSG